MGVYLGVKFLGHMVALCLIFRGTSWQVFTKGQHFIFLLVVSTYLPTLVIFCFFSLNYSHLSELEVASPFDFDLHFSDDHWYWASFHVLVGCGLFVYLLWRGVYQSALKERKKRKWSRSVMSDSLWPHGL